MTNPTPHLDDQSLSDLVDGTGPDYHRDHVDTCAECKARLDAFREVARMVSSTPSIPEEKREHAVEAALADLDNVSADGGSGFVPAVADDLAARRAARTRRRRGIAVRVAAAAAVFLTIGGVSALVVEGGGRTTHPASTARPGTHTSGGAGSAGGAISGAAASGQGAAGETEQVPSLGKIDTPGQLVAAIRSANPTPAPLSAALPARSYSPTSDTRCVAPAPPTTGGSLTLEATLVWKGTPALAFVFATSQRNTAVVEGTATCKVLATVSY